MSITVQLVGDDSVRASFDAMKAESRQAILNAVTKLSIDLQTKVVSEKLSGQVLNVRTGTLRRSITQRVEDNGSQISGIVGADLSTAKYAAAQEYGFKGTVSVKEYTKTITQAWGKSIRPTQVTVREHPMNMNLPERSYLRSSLAEMEPTILAALRDAVAQAQANAGL